MALKLDDSLEAGTGQEKVMAQRWVTPGCAAGTIATIVVHSIIT